MSKYKHIKEETGIASEDGRLMLENCYQLRRIADVLESIDWDRMAS